MMDRDDLTFTTCYQIAGAIKEDWEVGRPEEVTLALEALFGLHEPELLVDTVDRKQRGTYIIALELTTRTLKLVLARSDEWKTPTADMIKKEIVSRIKEYERQIKTLVEPVLGPCGPELHLEK